MHMELKKRGRRCYNQKENVLKEEEGTSWENKRGKR